MKKGCSKLLVAVLVAIMVITPIKIDAASYQRAIIITDDWNNKSFWYDPYLVLQDGISVQLEDLTRKDSNFLVPAGENFHFLVFFEKDATVNFIVDRPGYGMVVNKTLTGSGTWFIAPVLSVDAIYKFLLTSHGTVRIVEYRGVINKYVETQNYESMRKDQNITKITIN